MNKSRSFGLVFLVLFFGSMIGSILGEVLGFLLPPGVVKDFFLTSVYFDLAGVFGNAKGVISIDLLIVVAGTRVPLKLTSLFFSI